MPPEFWETAELQDALAQRHIGKVIWAYRHARLHGPRPIPQGTLANWLDLTQTQISRIENGPAPTDLKKLSTWAEALKIPRQYLWFQLPGDNPTPMPSCRAIERTATDATSPVRKGIPSREEPATTQDGNATVAEDLIAAVANTTRAHAARAEATDVGPGAVEQLRADVTELARAYVFTPPMPLFVEMNQVRGRIFDTLARKAHPPQSGELYLLAGAVCALMANACLDLGRCNAGDELARAAWTYGSIISHAGLTAWARGTQALASIIAARPHEAVGYLEHGLALQSTGMGAARLHSMSARAHAKGVTSQRAREELNQARRADEESHPQDLGNMLGGEFSFSEAKQQYYAAVTHVSLGDAREAETAAGTAIRLFENAPRHDRSYGCEALARSQLALARLMHRELEGAEEALKPIFVLPPAQRIISLTGYLESGRNLLRRPHFQGSPKARELDERLALFCTAGETRALTSGWNEHSSRDDT